MIAAAAMLTVSCSSKKQEKEMTNADWLQTTEVGASDSINIDGNAAVVSITGSYPMESTDDKATVEKIQSWLAVNLASPTFMVSDSLYDVTPAMAADGQQMADKTLSSLLDVSKADFAEFTGEEGATTEYQFMVHFQPYYTAGRYVTYLYASYGYTGGNHGGSEVRVVTFAREDGKILEWDDLFKADDKDAVMSLVKENLMTQYFGNAEKDENHPATLAEALLINPDELGYPSARPALSEDGVTFVYQQYEIAPYSAGMPECTIPYSSLESMMTSYAASLVK